MTDILQARIDMLRRLNRASLFDSMQSGRPQIDRQQLIAEMADHIVRIECACDARADDAFRALVHCGKYDVALMALCFKDAMYLAGQIVVGRQMTES